MDNEKFLRLWLFSFSIIYDFLNFFDALLVIFDIPFSLNKERSHRSFTMAWILYIIYLNSLLFLCFDIMVFWIYNELLSTSCLLFFWGPINKGD